MGRAIRRAPRLVVLLAAVALAAPMVVAESADRLGRAVQLREGGRSDEALALLEQVLVEEPDNHRALWNRGLVAMERAEFGDAIEWFDRAIAGDERVADYHLWRGYAYARKVESVRWFRKLFLASRIRRSLERAVELDPDHLKARRALQRYYEQAPSIVGGDEAKARAQAEAIRRLVGAP